MRTWLSTVWVSLGTLPVVRLEGHWTVFRGHIRSSDDCRVARNRIIKYRHSFVDGKWLGHIVQMASCICIMAKSWCSGCAPYMVSQPESVPHLTVGVERGARQVLYSQDPLPACATMDVV